MDRIAIATDSHSGIRPEEALQRGIFVLPMPFFVEGRQYFENVSITRQELFAYLDEGKTVTTSQPAPESLLAFWQEILNDHDQIVYIPMSSGLSSSCATAQALAQEPPFAGRVFVVDDGRVATPLRRTVMDALDLVRAGLDPGQIQRVLEEDRENVSIYIAVETLEHLKRGGRITPTTAAVGTLLNIKPILKLGTQTLDSYKKIRGMKKAREEMIEALRQDIQTTFRQAHQEGRLHLLAATSADPETTASWVAQIREAFPGMEVLCDDLTMGICCHTGPGALGIGCTCRPVIPGK